VVNGHKSATASSHSFILIRQMAGSDIATLVRRVLAEAYTVAVLLIKIIIITARRYAGTICAMVLCLSVRPPVCHKPLFCQNISPRQQHRTIVCRDSSYWCCYCYYRLTLSRKFVRRLIFHCETQR